MRERPEYRPKIFFTLGPMKGMEAPFPYSKIEYKGYKSLNCKTRKKALE